MDGFFKLLMRVAEEFLVPASEGGEEGGEVCVKGQLLLVLSLKELSERITNVIIYLRTRISHLIIIMARLTELTREHYNEFKKVKQIHSPLFGDCCLYGRKGAKYLAKHLDGTQHMPFTTTRTNSIPFYLPENKQSVYFFEQEGESLEGILEHKLISNRLSSKHNNS